jgi:hypothetical protein
MRGPGGFCGGGEPIRHRPIATLAWRAWGVCGRASFAGARRQCISRHMVALHTASTPRRWSTRGGASSDSPLPPVRKPPCSALLPPNSTPRLGPSRSYRGGLGGTVALPFLTTTAAAPFSERRAERHSRHAPFCDDSAVTLRATRTSLGPSELGGVPGRSRPAACYGASATVPLRPLRSFVNAA